ncbi:MAG: alkaline phosphatase family protein [Chloroflexota bacterium]|nr:alkaline phosphatase family protein [Chloroflexota bacterium]
MLSLKRMIERTSILSISLLVAACGSSSPAGNLPPTPTAQVTNTAPAATPIPTAVTGERTVFLIMMENHNWSDIKNSASAPYINKTLLPMASYAEQYYNPPGIHPSEPNYVWLEAGSNLGISDDADPDANHQSSTLHLVTLLNTASILWKSYQEGISGTVCPLSRDGLYAPKHNPMVFFDDVTNTNDPNSAYCIAHVRPYSELATDLQQNTQARYNFITPDLCNDMHDTCGPLNDAVKQGDTWLSQNLPPILNSQAYQSGGIVFITWDEGEGGDGPIGMIVLSPVAKGGGYSNTIHYTHSSLLRTLQEIFGVTPLLGDAASATDLGDLFTTFP